jgi:hypothetical protein
MMYVTSHEDHHFPTLTLSSPHLPLTPAGVAPESVGIGRAFADLGGGLVSANGHHAFVFPNFSFRLGHR